MENSTAIAQLVAEVRTIYNDAYEQVGGNQDDFFRAQAEDWSFKCEAGEGFVATLYGQKMWSAPDLDSIRSFVSRFVRDQIEN